MRDSGAPFRWLAVVCLLACQSAQAQPAANQTINLVSRHDGRCVGVQANASGSGALLQAQSCNGSTYQQWTLAAGTSSGAFTLRNVGSGLCADLPGASSSLGVQLQQWGCGSGAWQQWRFNDVGSGAYSVQSVQSGQVMDLDTSGSTGKVQQWGWAGSNNQRWALSASAVSTAQGPVGFAAGTTGGAGGEVVTVTDRSKLAAALCATKSSSGECTDTTPRIIKISGQLDFRNYEGSVTGTACSYSAYNCSVNGKFEKILQYTNYCSGKTTFAVTYDAAGGKPLMVGSNKTIIGVGANSGLKGKGLILRGGVSNIIIRNLSITDINDGLVFAGDAITLDNTRRVWIDHNRFARIGRQMIVAGFGTAQNVTISGNDFDGSTEYGHYCDGRAYWIMLLVGHSQSMSLVGNRFYNTSGRSPELGKPAAASTGGLFHLVNNYYQSNYYHALSGGNQVNALLEANYYSAGDYRPILDSTANKSDSVSNLNFAPIAQNIARANASCQSVLGRNCVANVDQNITASSTASNSHIADFLLNPAVMSTIAANAGAAQAIRSVLPLEASNVPAQKFGPQADIVP